MKIFRGRPIFTSVFTALAFALGCDDDGSVCLDVPRPLFTYSIRSQSGVDLTNTAHVVVRRLEGNPSVAVDSAQGRPPVVETAFQRQPGDYRITISHAGYVSQDRLATADPQDIPGCGPGAAMQIISVTLVPISQ